MMRVVGIYLIVSMVFSAGFLFGLWWAGAHQGSDVDG